LVNFIVVNKGNEASRQQGNETGTFSTFPTY